MSCRTGLSRFLILCLLTACEASNDEPDSGARDAETAGGGDGGARDGGRLDAGDASLPDDDADAAVLPGSRGDSGASDDDAGLDASAADASDASDEGDASDDGGDGRDGGQNNPGQNSIALPLEVILLTTATPYGLTGDRPSVLDNSSLRYVAAYEGDEPLKRELFRFVARDWPAASDLNDANAIAVWWSQFNSEGENTGFVCTTSHEGFHALYSLGLYNGETEPEEVWKAQCAWELIRQQTDEGIRYEIRKSSTGGKVGTTHANATQGNRVRVGSLSDALFELVAPL